MNHNQQPKPDPKGKAIASFVLGVAYLVWSVFSCLSIFSDSSSIILIYIVFWPYILTVLLFGSSPDWMFLLSLLPIPLIGVILGTKGLKSSKRNFAIAGIILSVVSLLFALFVLWILSSGFGGIGR